MIITLEERFDWKNPLVEVKIEMVILQNGEVREATTISPTETDSKFRGDDFIAFSRKIEETGKEMARMVDIIRSAIDYPESR